MKLSEQIKDLGFEVEEWWDEVEELIEKSNLSKEDKCFILGCMNTYNDMSFTTEQMYYELISDCEAIDE